MQWLWNAIYGQSTAHGLHKQRIVFLEKELEKEQEEVKKFKALYSSCSEKCKKLDETAEKAVRDSHNLCSGYEKKVTKLLEENLSLYRVLETYYTVIR